MFIRSMMNAEFECGHCGGLFRNTGHCPYCGNPTCWRIEYDSINGGGPPCRVTLDHKEPFAFGDKVRIQPALEWVLETILDECDAIVDERHRAKGIVPTDAQREAFRESMRKRLSAVLHNEEVAEKMRKAGAASVRVAVRQMYELKIYN